MTTIGADAGDYTYTPPTNFSGIDTFTYTVDDGNNPPVVSTVTINVTPIANSDTASTNVNTTLIQNTSVLDNDIGTGLFIPSPGFIASIQNGTVTINSNGTYTYVPPLNATGKDSFTYTLEDQAGNQKTTDVCITLLPVSNNDFYITYVNTPLDGSSVLENDPVPNDLIVVDFQMVSDEGGTVTMNANGTFTYTPPTDFTGVDTFTYTTQDPDGNQVTSTVTVTVIPRPAPPPPENFDGCIEKCKFLNKDVYHLVATWTAPNSPVITIDSYNIYLDGTLVQTIPADSELIFETCSCSKDELLGYEITSVSDFGVESEPVELEIVKEITL